jgi:hypothetical protein
MRNKDQIVLENIYLKSKHIIKEDVDDVFLKEVGLDIDLHFNTEEIFDINKPKSVMVKYRIDIDYRSYGIKEIRTSFVSANPFDIEVIGNDDSETPVAIDLSGLTEVDTEFSVGEYGQIFPRTLEVKLGPDMKPIEAKLIF